MKYKIAAAVAIGLGLIFLFAGDTISNVGSDVDSLIDNKWFAAGLIGLGGLGLAVQTKAFSKI